MKNLRRDPLVRVINERTLKLLEQLQNRGTPVEIRKMLRHELEDVGKRHSVGGAARIEHNLINGFRKYEKIIKNAFEENNIYNVRIKKKK